MELRGEKPKLSKIKEPVSTTIFDPYDGSTETYYKDKLVKKRWRDGYEEYYRLNGTLESAHFPDGSVETYDGSEKLIRHYGPNERPKYPVK